ncbi:GIY-YIG nuclease family protein [Parapedobacter lycopersici]|uniref:GIY-YIG nuclease family protein n=1 Tax=Parapedobacter lycopersici TaxID=1864939 RepID=UPI0035574CA1
MHYLYILYSREIDRFYIGSCQDLEQRLRRHNSHHRGYTGKVEDWRIIYTEEFPNRIKAGQREREIKSWKSRRLIEKLVQKT